MNTQLLELHTETGEISVALNMDVIAHGDKMFQEKNDGI